MKKLIVLLLAVSILLCGCGSKAEAGITPESSKSGGQYAPGAEQLESINRFLSIFVSQHFERIDRSPEGLPELISLLHSYIKVNAPGEWEYKPLDPGGMPYEYYSLDTVNRYSGALFGFTFEEQLIKDYIITGVDGDIIYSIYLNGGFNFMAADGELSNRFALAGECFTEPDGRIRVRFDVVSLEYETFFEEDGISDSYYRMSAEEGTASDKLTNRGSGEAVLIVNSNGISDYTLASFTVDYKV